MHHFFHLFHIFLTALFDYHQGYHSLFLLFFVLLSSSKLSCMNFSHLWFFSRANICNFNFLFTWDLILFALVFSFTWSIDNFAFCFSSSWKTDCVIIVSGVSKISSEELLQCLFINLVKLPQSYFSLHISIYKKHWYLLNHIHRYLSCLKILVTLIKNQVLSILTPHV